MAQEFKAGQKVVIVGVLEKNSNNINYPLALNIERCGLTFTKDGKIHKEDELNVIQDYNQFLEEIKTAEGLGKPLAEESSTKYDWSNPNHNHFNFIRSASLKDLQEFTKIHKLPTRIFSVNDIKEILCHLTDKGTVDWASQLNDLKLVETLTSLHIQFKKSEGYKILKDKLRKYFEEKESQEHRAGDLRLEKEWRNLDPEIKAVILKPSTTDEIKDEALEKVENARKLLEKKQEMWKDELSGPKIKDFEVNKNDFTSQLTAMTDLKSTVLELSLKRQLLQAEAIIAQLKLENFNLQNNI